MRVLVVDDSLTVRMDLGDAFSAVGHDVMLCASAQEAREAIAHSVPHVVVLDVVLPDGDGVEFLGELRKGETTRDVPVILLSSEDQVRDRLRGMGHGADAFIGKPYDADYLVARAHALTQAETLPEADVTPLLLIVDDSSTYRGALTHYLEDRGYRTAQASSGETGLRRTAELRPDAIIVDGIMPGIAGAEFIRAIRLDAGLSSTPCLLLTASDGAATEVEALDAGADAYAHKGDGLDVLHARVQAILRNSGPLRERARQPTLMSPKRILAVDDSPTYLEALSEELRRGGYEVVRARSGEEALALLEVENVDCILLDLLMPGLSGTEACRRIKTMQRLRDTPIIILTAREEKNALIDGINSGADDYVGKSSSNEVILARIRAQLRRKQFEDENRRIREDLLKKEAETLAAREVARVRESLLAELSLKNEQLAFHLEELQRLNRELETFAYSVSHDLRQPLRSMDGFSQALFEKYEAQLDDDGRHYLQRIRDGATRMGRLIEGLLSLSRVGRLPVERQQVDLSRLVRKVAERLLDSQPERKVQFVVAPDVFAQADPNLIESVLENLLGNAWKFTSKVPLSEIEFGVLPGESGVYFIRDNGAGFDMRYADSLFGPFQRLHATNDFEGTGIGLATVQRIIHRHGGKTWAQSAVGEGATFFFTVGGELIGK